MGRHIEKMLEYSAYYKLPPLDKVYKTPLKTEIENQNIEGDNILVSGNVF